MFLFARPPAEAASIAVDFGGDGNVDEDDVDANDVALRSSSENLKFLLQFWIRCRLSNPLSS